MNKLLNMDNLLRCEQTLKHTNKFLNMWTNSWTYEQILKHVNKLLNIGTNYRHVAVKHVDKLLTTCCFHCKSHETPHHILNCCFIFLNWRRYTPCSTTLSSNTSSLLWTLPFCLSAFRIRSMLTYQDTLLLCLNNSLLCPTNIPMTWSPTFPIQKKPA